MNILTIQTIYNATLTPTAGENTAGACWHLSEGAANELSVGDVLKVVSQAGWANAPETLSVEELGQEDFLTTQMPAYDEAAPVSVVLAKEKLALPEPTTLQWDITDVESSAGRGQNMLGKLFCDRIGTKRTISCSWSALKSREMATLMQALDEKFFYLEFPDARTGKREIMEVYVGQRSAPLYRMDEGAQTGLWASMNVTFTER